MVVSSRAVALFYILIGYTGLLHTYALDKKRTIWFVAHPTAKYIHVTAVSFLTQVVLAALKVSFSDVCVQSGEF
jgi:hypothetical protein